MILLIKPKTFSMTRYPPLGLGYLSAVIKRRGGSCEIFDLDFPEARDRLDRRLGGERPAWIGISVSCQNAPNAGALASELKKMLPSVPIVIGGTYTSSLPELSLEETEADIAVIGEAELTVEEIDNALSEGARPEGIAGIVFRSNGGAVRTAGRPPHSNIDEFPFPDYEQIPPSRYTSGSWQIVSRGKMIGPIMTSRGCPYKCTFCAASVTMGRGWRRRSPRLVGEEMEYLHQRFGVDEFSVVDDNLAGTREHAAAFCEEILRRGLKIHWKTPNGVRAENLDVGLLSLMKRSGCYMLGFGIESGDPDVLRRVGKPIQVENILETMRLAAEAGILTFGYFILGLPGDTPETIEKTIRTAMDPRVGMAHFSLCIPYPGSKIYDELTADRQAEARRGVWHFVAFQLGCVEPETLKRTLRNAYVRFFLRPRKIALVARYVRPGNFMYLLRIAMHYMGFVKLK